MCLVVRTVSESISRRRSDPLQNCPGTWSYYHVAPDISGAVKEPRKELSQSATIVTRDANPVVPWALDLY